MANEVLIRVLERKRKYMWPEAQLNFWLIVMIAAAATIVGVFTYFMQLQSVFHLGVPCIQLYGPTGSVNSYCNLYRPSSGLADGEATLAWLETQGICQDWKAAFAFYIVGTVFLLWMMVMAYQVNQDNFD
ncbi:MAG: hypothetical protein ASARMPRED_007114 [Alectoria sarmentosa]|nr:MAG: hypothetical protein ASARMPRED_007114 [Alectoria sarmentosa]